MAAKKLTVVIAGDTKGLSSSLGSAESALGSFGEKVAAVFTGQGLLDLTKSLARGVVDFAQGIYDLGASFDDAFDSIQVATGATGAQLEDLKQTWRDVFADVPTSMGDAATAVGLLNARLDITGSSLEATSETLLQFARLTGADTAQAVNLVTRLMGDWSIATDDASGVMDKLLVAQQQTGVSWETLAEQAVQFGAPLRQLGFDFNTTLAALAKFNAEGVNTELVMGAMRIALGKLAKAEDGESGTVRKSTGDRKAQMRAVEDAQRAVEDSAKAVEKANQRVIDSQKELDDLLKGPDQKTIEEAKLSQAEAALAVDQAVQRQADAQQELNDAVKDGDPTKIRRAQLALRDATLSLTRAQQRATEAGVELNRVTNFNADTDQKVLDARQKLADAQEGAAAASDRVAQAQQRVADAQERMTSGGPAASASADGLEKTIKRLGLTSEDVDGQFAGLMKSIKDAPDTITATRLAVELFGAKAGPDMAAAIREGRLDGLDPLMQSLLGASGTVNATAADTEDFSERFQIAMNNLKLAVEPIVMKVFDWFSNNLAPAIERVANAMKEDGLGGAIKELRTIFEENWPAIQRAVTDAISKMIEWLVDHSDEFAKEMFEFGTRLGEEMALGFVESFAKKVPGGQRVLDALGSDGHILDDYAKEHGLPTHHSGGIFRAPNPGGVGLALLRDGERVSTPGMATGGDMTHVTVQIGEKVLFDAVAKYARDNSITLVASS